MQRPVKAFTLVLLVASMAVALASCTSAPADPLALAEADGGSSQTVGVGQQLRITLDSNPTTGYRWAVDGAVPAQLEQVGEPAYTAGSNAIGAGGTEVWTFTARAAGDAILKLKYWRSFEPTVAPERTFEIRVNVR